LKAVLVHLLRKKEMPRIHQGISKTAFFLRMQPRLLRRMNHNSLAHNKARATPTSRRVARAFDP
jgi:hypothetical protein